MALVLAAAACTRPGRNGAYMDQMAFLLQAMSFAHDLDFRYTPADRERFLKLGWETEPRGLFLRKFGDIYYFGKPVLYAVLCAPFVRFSPNTGPLVLNALLWAAIAGLTYVWLARYLPPVQASALSVLCWGATAIVFYVFVIHADMLIILLLTAFLFAGLTPFAPNRVSPDGPGVSVGRAVAAGILGGFMIYEKLPMCFFAASILALWWVRSCRKAALIASLSLVLPLAALSGIHWLEDGHLSPYQGDRIYVSKADPFSEKLAVSGPPVQMKTGEYFTRGGIGRSLSLERISALLQYAPRLALHFFLGRKVGLFPYMIPFFLLLLPILAGLRRSSGRLALWTLAPAAAYVAFYYCITPLNYHGGATALGNRYAEQIAPAVIFSLGWSPLRLWPIRALLAVSAAAVVYFPGRLFLRPDTAVRDNYLIFQWNRFRLLPLEPELLHKCDANYCFFDIAPKTRMYRLSEPDPALSHSCSWFGGKAHSRFAVVRESAPGAPLAFRISSASSRVKGHFRSGRRNTSFEIGPGETRSICLALADPVVVPPVEGDKLYCWPVSIVIDEASSGQHDAYLPEGAALHVNFCQPAEEFPQLAPEGRVIELADAGVSSLLAWGWWDVEERTMPRWAGGARSTAIAVPAWLVRKLPSSMLLTGSSLARPLSAHFQWPGLPPQTFTLTPKETTFSLKIRGNPAQTEDLLLRIDHDELRVPAELTECRSRDLRGLSGSYRQFIFPADLPTSSAVSRTGREGHY